MCGGVVFDLSVRGELLPSAPTYPPPHAHHTQPPATANREEAEAVGSFKDLLEEIPVTVRNPGIISALLFDMQVGGLLAPPNRIEWRHTLPWSHPHP